MRLKIISDGTPKGTRVVDAWTGEAVEQIVSVSWRVDAETRLPRATIVCNCVPLEVVADKIRRYKLTNERRPLFVGVDLAEPGPDRTVYRCGRCLAPIESDPITGTRCACAP